MCFIALANTHATPEAATRVVTAAGTTAMGGGGKCSNNITRGYPGLDYLVCDATSKEAGVHG